MNTQLEVGGRQAEPREGVTREELDRVERRYASGSGGRSRPTLFPGHYKYVFGRERSRLFEERLANGLKNAFRWIFRRTS